MYSQHLWIYVLFALIFGLRRPAVAVRTATKPSTPVRRINADFW
jgi:hypothetical protein